MENIIQELIKIEKLAKEVTEQIEGEKKNLPLEISEKCKEIDSEIGRTTRETIEKIKAKAIEESNDKISKISVSAQNKYSELESLFNENAEKWRNGIFNEVVGRRT